MRNNLIDSTTWKFILTGIANTVVGTAVMYGLYNLAGCSYWVSSAGNYLVGSILSYFLNRNFTFKHKGNKIISLIKFMVNIIFCYIIAYGLAEKIVLMVLLKLDSHTRGNIAMAMGMVLFVGLNYLGQRFFVFSKKTSGVRI